MTNLELMTILGNVRSEYILEAQQLRSGEAKKAIRALSRKKLILITAAISLLLLLVGCVAVLLGDLTVGLFQASSKDAPSGTGGVPEKIMIGETDLRAAAKYYQAQYPNEEVKAYLHDFDGNGSGDLAVWRGGTFWALYVTDEENRVKAEYRMDESLGFDIYETYTQMENQVRYDGNLIGILEKGADETYQKFCWLGENGLYLRECFKFDPNGKESCYFVSVTDSWDAPYDAEITQWKPLTDAEYTERLESYRNQPYDLKPVSEYFDVRENRIVPGGESSTEEQPLSDSEKAALKKEADERLLLCLKDQYSFYRVDDGMEYTLADHCRQESDILGFPVSITRYTFVDMDRDSIQEAVVDFQFGENEQVMCMVLRYDCGTIYGTEFYHRQLQNIKVDGTFAYSGGGDDDGWARLRWENREWVTEKVGPIGYGDSLKDVVWYSYPINSNMSEDGSISFP